MLGSFYAVFFQMLDFIFPASLYYQEWLSDKSCNSAFRTRFLSLDMQKTIKCKSIRTKTLNIFGGFFQVFIVGFLIFIVFCFSQPLKCSQNACHCFFLSTFLTRKLIFSLWVLLRRSRCLQETADFQRVIWELYNYIQARGRKHTNLLLRSHSFVKSQLREQFQIAICLCHYLCLRSGSKTACQGENTAKGLTLLI